MKALVGTYNQEIPCDYKTLCVRLFQALVQRALRLRGKWSDSQHCFILAAGETGGYKVVIRFPTIPNTVFIFKNYNCRPQDLFLWTHQPKIRKRMKGFWLMKPFLTTVWLVQCRAAASGCLQPCILQRSGWDEQERCQRNFTKHHISDIGMFVHKVKKTLIDHWRVVLNQSVLFLHIVKSFAEKYTNPMFKCLFIIIVS